MQVIDLKKKRAGTSGKKLLELEKFRRQAIEDLEEIKNRYLETIKFKKHLGVEDEEYAKLERAIKILPGILKAEEGILASAAETERRESLERLLEPLFRVLRGVLGQDFDAKREEILTSLEAELDSDVYRR